MLSYNMFQIFFLKTLHTVNFLFLQNSKLFERCSKKFKTGLRPIFEAQGIPPYAFLRYFFRDNVPLISFEEEGILVF
jgi:hypothetical protein